MDIASLRARYLSGELHPMQLLVSIQARIAEDEHGVWIYRLSTEELHDYVDAILSQDIADLPLYGIPFAIKDNIDLAGVPTTAGCPEYAYVARRHATAVQLLINAGAIPIGKTNLDQFATGLNGTRSPYGVCRNAYDPEYISGGSSSGSAVAVALGYASFSLGTDTAGSGRVPAAFNNLIGVKATKGWISTHGVVPACRSLDCVSIFALNSTDAGGILEIAAQYDAQDEYSRQRQAHGFDFGCAEQFRFGIPKKSQLNFFGNTQAELLFQRSCTHLQQLGGIPVEIDFSAFLEAARLLYEGPWVAERYAAISKFFDSHRSVIHPVVSEIIAGAGRYSAADAYRGMYRLEALRKEAESVWASIDCLLTPTAGTIYRIDEMLSDPIRLNANLGYYTNFMNLLDCAAVAVPAGFQENGLPFGVTLAAPAHQDVALLNLAARMSDGERGTSKQAAAEISAGRVRVAVCGAHLSGLSLNHQLTQRGAHLVARTHSSAEYRLYALPGLPPLRPGMVRVEHGETGYAIEVEIWEMAAREFGSFVAGIPAPLGIGKLQLQDGSHVNGFICEPYVISSALDISHHGGWRNYLAQLG